MKKVLVAMVAIALVGAVILGGCAETSPTPAPAPAPTSTPTPTPAEVIELKLSTHGPAQGPNEQALGEWADMIYEKSGGRVKVTCYYGAALVKASDAREATEKGVIDIGFCAGAETAARTPLTMLMSTPGLGIKNGKVGTAVWQELLKTNAGIQKEYESCKWLMGWIVNPVRFNMTKKAVRVPEDLKGIKIIAPGTSTASAEFLGAGPVVQSPAEWYTSLDTGLAEGILTSAFVIDLFKIAPICKYNTFGVDMGFTGEQLLMNWDSWNSLPPDVQDMIDNEISPYTQEKIVNMADENEVRLTKEWEEQDHVLTYPSEEDMKLWEAVFSELHEELIADKEAKGLPAREAFEQLKQLIVKYNAMD